MATTRKKRTETINWNKRDEECLAFAKNVVEKLLKMEGKPISPTNIRSVTGVKGDLTTRSFSPPLVHKRK